VKRLIRLIEAPGRRRRKKGSKRGVKKRPSSRATTRIGASRGAGRIGGDIAGSAGATSSLVANLSDLMNQTLLGGGGGGGDDDDEVEGRDGAGGLGGHTRMRYATQEQGQQQLQEAEEAELDLEEEEALGDYHCRLLMHQRVQELVVLKKQSYRKVLSKGLRCAPSFHLFVDGYWLERLLHAFSRCEDWAQLLSSAEVIGRSSRTKKSRTAPQV
jgi:hypothetical protein